MKLHYIALALLMIITPLNATPQNSPEPVSTTANADIQIIVDGMVCSFCAQGIKNTFKDQKGIHTIAFDFDQRSVYLTLNKDSAINDKEIDKLIQNSGYVTEKIIHLH